MKRTIAVLLLLCLLAGAAACGKIVPGGPEPTAEPTLTAGPTAPPTQEAHLPASAEPSPTGEPAATPTPEPTPEPDASPTAAPTATPSPAPTSSPRPTEEPTPAPTPAPTPEPAPEPDPGGVFDLPSGLFEGGLELLELPADSGEYSVSLAVKAQALCTAQGRDSTRQTLETAGFTVLKQVNYDKSDRDISHTCAWTLGKKEIAHGGETRTLLLITVRGTSGGEWYSNFDFVPSRQEDSCYAENFLACAQEVLDGLRDTLEAEARPLLLICGHSRGAACANLLGLLLDEERGSEDIYVYTFATPTTVRGEVLERSYPNIFNLINPCDIVTMLPPPTLGFGRAGRDIILPNDREKADALSAGIQSLGLLIPNITAYYTVRHSITGPGLSEDGLTAFEFLCAAAGAFSEAGGASLFTEGAPVTVAPDSDFAPLMGLLAGSGEAGSTQAFNVAMQHLPLTYMALMLASTFFG